MPTIPAALLLTYGAVMTAEQADPVAVGNQPVPDPRESDAAAHLDEDVEAAEDPVHAGDARHQRERHDADPAPDPTGP
jgi:hypothetical protein